MMPANRCRHAEADFGRGVENTIPTQKGVSEACETAWLKRDVFSLQVTCLFANLIKW
jgi:hypothetical protein